MFEIKKIRADHTIDFAAEELKRYLRMMMPECGEIGISSDPSATDGFRLGLLSDFGLPDEAADPVLDDVIHIDTTEKGGVLAGSNPRSVLFAVYRFLRENGCRWLYPGPDGDYVPVRDIVPVRYHRQADHRFRGHCNEGTESRQCMLETIDFYAKQEINVYMLEFDNPYYYYNEYYSHHYNEENRPPEPVSPEQVKQWKRECEAEIAKRGLQFHDMGHGWTAEPFGFSSTEGWVESRQEITDEQRQWVAEIDGKREFFQGVPINTNLCMSNPFVRSHMADGVVRYAAAHRNVTYLHVSLADGIRNHCECEECRKMSPSDFFVMILNEIDEKLTKEGLDTRIAFSAYQDTLFAPERMRIKNPARFSMLYAPINRSYLTSISEDSVIPEPIRYVRNKWATPWTTEENYALLRKWKECYSGLMMGYEYHYWRPQYHDPGFMYISRRIYEDARGLKVMGLSGYIEDGSQRSFFPNGLPIYVYAEVMMDRDCDYEAVVEDYFRHAYGEPWRQVRDYMQKVTDLFDFAYMSGKKSADGSRLHYNPEQVEKLEQIPGIARVGREIALAHLSMPTRPQTVSMRLLLRHSEYIEGLAKCMIEKARGNEDAAFAAFEEFRKSFGKYEFEIERYFDHGLAFTCHRLDIKRPPRTLVAGQ
ncbi:MAG: DUF4838 domain-containing protein [Lachnospiraceae bacterium]|nr:DUF4838 domain-containing protein [Lachnospiraceae bacterium]